MPGVFKAFIFFGTIAVAALFMVYTQFLINGLQENIKRDVRMWAKLWELAGAEDSSPRVNAVVFEEIIQKAYFPIIVTDHHRNPVLWARIPGIADTDTSKAALNTIQEYRDRMLNENGETWVIEDSSEYKLVRKNSLGDVAWATPAIARGSLFIRTYANLYRLQNKDKR